MPMYSIVNDTENKKLIFTFIGFMSVDEGKLFKRDLAKVIREIVPRDYMLVVDSREMKPVLQEIISEFRESLKFYMSMNFKKIYIIASESYITHNQAQRVMKEVGFSGIYIDSPDKAV
jgi:hypothetical protein